MLFHYQDSQLKNQTAEKKFQDLQSKVENRCYRQSHLFLQIHCHYNYSYHLAMKSMQQVDMNLSQVKKQELKMYVMQYQIYLRFR